MNKIKITESQLQFVLKRLINEQIALNEPSTTVSPQVTKSFNDVINKTINLISEPTKRRPEGVNWGNYKIIKVQQGENGVLIFIVQEVNEQGKNRWGNVELIYDPKSPEDLFLRNENDNYGKIVTCKPLTNYFKQFNKLS
jgi:hypothetical protein